MCDYYYRSIKHLQDASRADGKLEFSLTKLKLFRQFYIMVSIYSFMITFIGLYCLVRVYLSLSSLASLAPLGLLMMKTVNKYTINSLVSDLLCDRQRM